jgi:hypothetical protein
MSINSDIPFLECSKISLSEKFPIIHVNTSMFNNTRLGHCRLLHQMSFRHSGSWAFRHIHEYYSPQDISTIKYLPLAARYRTVARRLRNTALHYICFVFSDSRIKVNPLPLNVIYICRTALLTSRCCILNIYSTNIRTEYFKHAA